MRKRVRSCRNPVAPRVALLVETSLASGREILRGIARYVREHRPWTLYHEPHALEDSVPRWLKRWRGDGIIARVQTPAMARAVAALGIPVVDVLGVVESPFPLVHVDDYAIARMAAEHFMERGLERFGFFGIEGENWSRQRYEGLCAAVSRLQTSVPLYELPRRTLDARAWERMENDLARWVGELPRPAGVWVCSDQRGPQFLEACRRAGVAVPDEIAVLGVDDDEPLCEVCNPPLSSIQPDHARVGYEAASLLASMLRDGARDKVAKEPESRPLPVAPRQVVARLSTDTLAIGDELIEAALRIIRDRAHLGVQVPAIARELGVSRSVLQRRFRSALKRPVHQEIMAGKLKKARELLEKTNLSLAAVAERAGFQHQEYMGAVFKSKLGTTPGAVRRRSG